MNMTTDTNRSKNLRFFLSFAHTLFNPNRTFDWNDIVFTMFVIYDWPTCNLCNLFCLRCLCCCCCFCCFAVVNIYCVCTSLDSTVKRNDMTTFHRRTQHIRSYIQTYPMMRIKEKMATTAGWSALIVDQSDNRLYVSLAQFYNIHIADDANT